MVRLSKPQVVKTELFDIKTSSSQLGYPRFGFVIPKKIDKRAVVRNSQKRKLSASIEEIFDRIKGGRDFVFYIKAEIVNTEQSKVNNEIQMIFNKEGFLND